MVKRKAIMKILAFVGVILLLLIVFLVGWCVLVLFGMRPREIRYDILEHFFEKEVIDGAGRFSKN